MLQKNKLLECLEPSTTGKTFDYRKLIVVAPIHGVRDNAGKRKDRSPEDRPNFKNKNARSEEVSS